MDGLIVPAGHGRKLITKAQEVTFKVTEAHGSLVSSFEVVVPSGFDVGAHTHERSGEFFYILEGELDLLAFEPTERTREGWQDWESPIGDRVVRASTGSCMFIPAGCPHAFMNSTARPARMLFQSYPSPGHEHYFEEICEIFSTDQEVDANAVQELRDRYDVHQITPLGYRPHSHPTPASSPSSALRR